MKPTQRDIRDGILISLMLCAVTFFLFGVQWLKDKEIEEEKRKTEQQEELVKALTVSSGVKIDKGVDLSDLTKGKTMAKYDLVFSFDIDDGQLDGLTPAQCFVLGYELSSIDWAVRKSLRPQVIGFHSKNRDRVMKLMAERHKGRKFSVSWMEGDKSEEWMVLSVEDGGECSFGDERQ